MDKQMFLTVYYTIDGDDDRHVHQGEVIAHIGEAKNAPITADEMQDIVYAAKMRFAELMRERGKHQ